MSLKGESRSMDDAPPMDGYDSCDDAKRPLRDIAEIYVELGSAYLHAGDELRAAGNAAQADARYEEAAQAYERAIQERGRSRSACFGLARSRERQGRLEDALRAYLEVVRADPASAVEFLPRVQYRLTPGLARALGPWLDGEWTRDVRGAALDPVVRAAVGMFLGRVSLYRGDYVQAANWYRSALDVIGDDTFVLEGLGEALWRTGKAAEAVPFLEHAVRRGMRCASAVAR
jgi:tetratricopeptide (TPR) repeat protein